MTAVSFGHFVLDRDTRELRDAGRRVALSPKAYQLLDVLVTNRPKALAKSDLQEQLWPGTFVVEKNLVNLIAEIRAALGDDATHPTFVRTVHRFGYAFRDPASQPDAARQVRRQDARFRLVWAGGRVGLADGEYILGRDPDLELFLDAADISRRHARIVINGEDATIEDLESKNGTFIADDRVDAVTRLGDGDSIRVGSVELTFTAIRSRGSTETEHRIGRTPRPRRAAGSP
jgi:DNA-binding winged helix-turn-helix (wHTH) protein